MLILVGLFGGKGETDRYADRLIARLLHGVANLILYRQIAIIIGVFMAWQP